MTNTFVLKLEISRVEADLASAFLSGNVTLGSAAARSESDIAVTGSKNAYSTLVTERYHQLSIELPKNDFFKEPEQDVHSAVGGVAEPKCPRLEISSRARVNLTACRTGAAINGVIVSTMSGQGSIPLHELLRKDSDEKEPFINVPVQYASWHGFTAVFGLRSAKVVVATNEPDKEDADVDVDAIVLFDHNLNNEIAQVQPLIKQIYDDSWALRQAVVYAKSPFLTKPIAAVPVGQDASKYELAASINDTPSSFPPEQLEPMLARCMQLEFKGSEESMKEYESMRAALSDGPNLSAATKFSKDIATSLSTLMAFTKPYRVDGTPILLPTGLAMVQAESWLLEPTRSIFMSDDCDGSASSIIATIQKCVDVAKEYHKTKDEHLSPKNLPHMHVVANSLGAYFVYGVSVLGANAGNAAAADTTKTAIAGHAVAICIPTVQFLEALQRGGRGVLPQQNGLYGGPVIARDIEAEVAKARFEALGVTKAIARDVKAEEDEVKASVEALRPPAESNEDDHGLASRKVAMLASRKVAEELNGACNSEGLQFLAIEGTTPASARTYEHNPEARKHDVLEAKRDSEVAKRLAPNVSRTHKALHAVTNNEDNSHGFYSEFVEMSVSMRSPLFTDGALRSLGHASPHFVLVRNVVGAGEPVTSAGATPKQIATGDYALVPLWRVDSAHAAVLDQSSTEARLNLMPARNVSQPLTERESHNLAFSISMLKMLKSTFDGCSADGDDDPKFHRMRHVFSFSSLARNPEAVAAFARNVRTIPNIGGHFECDDVAEIAAYPSAAVKEDCVARQMSVFDFKASPDQASYDATTTVTAPKELEAPAGSTILSDAGRFCVLFLRVPIVEGDS